MRNHSANYLAAFFYGQGSNTIFLRQWWENSISMPSGHEIILSLLPVRNSYFLNKGENIGFTLYSVVCTRGCREHVEIEPYILTRFIKHSFALDMQKIIFFYESHTFYLLYYNYWDDKNYDILNFISYDSTCYTLLIKFFMFCKLNNNNFF